MLPLNPTGARRLTTLDGVPASCLGLAAGPKQDPRCVRRAFAGGINYFFFYGPGHTSFIEEVAALVPRNREQIIVATGSGSRRVAGLRAARRKLAALLGIGVIVLLGPPWRCGDLVERLLLPLAGCQWGQNQGTE
jgi:hypothetical protein